MAKNLIVGIIFTLSVFSVAYACDWLYGLRPTGAIDYGAATDGKNPANPYNVITDFQPDLRITGGLLKDNVTVRGNWVYFDALHGLAHHGISVVQIWGCRTTDGTARNTWTLLWELDVVAVREAVLENPNALNWFEIGGDATLHDMLLFPNDVGKFGDILQQRRFPMPETTDIDGNIRIPKVVFKPGDSWLFLIRVIDYAGNTNLYPTNVINTLEGGDEVGLERWDNGIVDGIGSDIVTESIVTHKGLAVNPNPKLDSTNENFNATTYASVHVGQTKNEVMAILGPYSQEFITSKKLSSTISEEMTELVYINPLPSKPLEKFYQAVITFKRNIDLESAGSEDPKVISKAWTEGDQRRIPDSAIVWVRWPLKGRFRP